VARAKSKRRKPELPRLYFSIDRSERSYWFGINHTNRHVWPEKFWEHDAVELYGSIRLHTTSQ
jgi:hypothetical protein